MKSIVVTYPYFQSLPKGIKMMLVASENFFFSEAGGGSDCRERLRHGAVGLQPRPWSSSPTRTVSMIDYRVRAV